ncbi:phosphoserine transaminase [Sneathiella litorea]|uniref:phosphoserine transaminase n=1 Tax=Sneathiella litorea TaxID=2606216 RepID=A0A6L8WCJ0_9PROT|nr:phosphoserine transaminase [Sneathiella litorea]MZR32133.1 phosphoserine transaminase [Sneathiella litorea]
MTVQMRPERRPNSPLFSSGPCAKRPGWSLQNLEDTCLGRSHRSGEGKAKLKAVIDKHRALLGIPDDYKIGIVPGSDTGAVEMALWSMLGARPVTMLAWESFGAGWATDVVKQLKLNDAEVINAEYGEIPDLAATDWSRDTVFTWNGTTSGVRVPNGDWISDDREGLAICDATSAVFAMELPWEKLDVVTWSWQKVLGGEAAHGMLVLSPRAVERLESYTPAWPLPKVFRMTKGGKLIEGIFKGETINTPSMLAVEDALDALDWAETVGGGKGMVTRTDANAKVISDWVAKTDWVDYLAGDPAIRSTTSVCLKITDDWFTALPAEDQPKAAKELVNLLAAEGAALDIGHYRDAPAGLRIWAGATVETADLEALMPWLDWGYATLKNTFQK